MAFFFFVFFVRLLLLLVVFVLRVLALEVDGAGDAGEWTTVADASSLV